MNWIEIKPMANGNIITYTFQLGGEWSKAFNINGASGWWKNVGNGKYLQEDIYGFDTTEVPDSIKAIPFLCNILPIA